MENVKPMNSNIKGWGIDTNMKDHPAYPMKEMTVDDHKGMSWIRPEFQPLEMEILHSIERPDVTAVYGTSVPLKGLSGRLRRFAFRYSESSWYHWFTLMLADRVNMVEGLFSDLRKGHVPNIFSEMGIKSEYRHNPGGLAAKVLIGSAITYVLISRIRKRY